MKSKVIGMSLIVIASLLVSPVVFSQERIDIEELRIPHEVHVLDNGLTLIVHLDVDGNVIER